MQHSKPNAQAESSSEAPVLAPSPAPAIPRISSSDLAKELLAALNSQEAPVAAPSPTPAIPKPRSPEERAQAFLDALNKGARAS